MALEIVTGSTLVILTWVAAAALAVTFGRWAPVTLDRRVAPDRAWRAGLWWGLSLVSIAVVAVGLVVPLGSGAAAAALLLGGLVLAAVGVVIRRPRRPQWDRPGAAVWAFLAAMAFSVAYLAVKALGPVTNYDTGLYHLGAVKYAHDFAAIPGLATLYFPFGYANAQFPLAAVLGNGPWDGLGYRLLNGVIVVLALTELASRLLNGRWSWGTFVLVVGLSASLVPLVAMADAVVASPTADTSVLVITIMSAAYLADALEHRRMSVDLSVALILSALLVMLRPTMAFFALGTAVVALLVVWRRRGGSATTMAFWILTSSAVAVMAVSTVLRDRILSGWLLYPLSLVQFDVPWLAADPTSWRDATLAAARDPAAPDQYVVAHSWGWVDEWLARLPSQWEFWFVVAAAVAVLATGAYARHACGFPRSPKRLLAVMAPSGLALAAWFLVSPPSFRFVWGPLFCLFFVPLGAALGEMSRSRVTLRGRRAVPQLAAVGAAVSILIVTGWSATMRNQVELIEAPRTWVLGPLRIPYAVAPVPLPPVTQVTLPSGLTVITPEPGSDQCWDNYPLCTFNPPSEVRLRGDSLQDGFTVSR